MKISTFTRMTTSFLPFKARAQALADSIAAATPTYADGPAIAVTAVDNAFTGIVAGVGSKFLLIPGSYANFVIYNHADGTLAEFVSPGSSGLKFRGGVLLEDGRVLMIPYAHNRFAFVNLNDGTYTQSSVDHLVTASSYNGGCLMADGRVALVPSVATAIGIYDPRTDVLTNGPVIGTGFTSALCLPNGDILFAASGSVTLVVWSPTTGTVTTFVPFTETGTNVIRSVRLCLDGKVAIMPGTGRYIYIFDYLKGTAIRSNQLASQVDKYGEPAIGADGKIYLPPDQMAAWAIVDPATGYVSSGPASPVTKAFSAAGLAADGLIIAAPRLRQNLGILTPHAPVTVPDAVRLNWRVNLG